jgi:hypothetical protein
MTVGQPETNLDTWGLRYVKKKEVTTQLSEGDLGRIGAPAKERRMIEPTQAPRTGSSAKPSSTTTASNIITPSRSSNIDVGREGEKTTEMTSHGGRQNDSAGDKDVKIVGHAGRESGHTPEVATQIQSPKEGKFGVGSSAPEGATHHVGSGKVMSTGRQGKPRKDRVTGKPTQSNPDVASSRNRGTVSGESASHTSGIRSQNVDRLAGTYDTTDLGSDDPSRVDAKGNKLKPSEGKSKPQKRGTPEGSKTGGATPKIKAALDYAIIQCQLLKMNNITKGWFSDEIQTGKYGKPDRVAPDPKKSPDKQSVKEPRSTVNNERKDETEVTSYGEGATGKHGKQGDKKLNVGGKVVDTNNERPRTSVKSDDVVAKAIELINVAYDEMNKAEGGDSGTATTGTEGTTNFVYSDVQEKKKQEDDEDNKERNRRSEDEDSKEDWAKHN